jgi:hypothetical protein
MVKELTEQVASLAGFLLGLLYDPEDGGDACRLLLLVYCVTVKSRGRTQTETPHQMTLDFNLSGT